MNLADMKAGQRVRIVQAIERREGTWRHEVVGTILRLDQEKTGSWYAHAKDARLWLLRVRLQKDDGELTTVTVDQFTEIDLLAETATDV